MLLHTVVSSPSVICCRVTPKTYEQQDIVSRCFILLFEKIYLFSRNTLPFRQYLPQFFLPTKKSHLSLIQFQTNRISISFADYNFLLSHVYHLCSLSLRVYHKIFNYTLVKYKKSIQNSNSRNPIYSRECLEKYPILYYHQYREDIVHSG